MTVEAICASPTRPTLLKLAKFSDRQLAVANTWADHFRVSQALRERFMLDYLSYTSSTRCWCVVINGSEPSQIRVLARFGSVLQYFDGHRITAALIKPVHRVPTSAPTPTGASNLATRVMQGRFAGPAILTSFSKQARELAIAESEACLGVIHKQRHVSHEGRNKRYFGPRNRFYITAIGAALKRFCQYLDPLILHAVRSVQSPSAELYNWLAEGDTSRRLQAVKSQPVLVPLLVMGDQLPWPHNVNHTVALSPWTDLQRFCKTSDDGGCERRSDAGAMLIGVVADTGLPLNRVLAWLFSQPVSSIRYIGQQRVWDTGSALTRMAQEGQDSGWHALLAGALLGNRRPHAKVQWRSFMKFRHEIPWQITSYLYDMNCLLRGCPTDWADPAWTGIAARISDLKEIFDNLDRVQTNEVYETTHRLKGFLASLSFRQASNLIDAFHVALEEIRIEMDREYPQSETDALTAWKGLLHNAQSVECPNGLNIVELRCPQDLDDESTMLRHCIDTYDYRAYLGSCRLFSVRKQNMPLASVELKLLRHPNDIEGSAWSPKHLTTMQIRGARNAAPASNSPVQEAYDWFYSQIKSGQISVNLEWPDQTLHMRRYADVSMKSRFAQILTRWLNEYMDRGL